MDFLNKLTGAKPAQKPVEDSGMLEQSTTIHTHTNIQVDFADFAAAPDPSPASIPLSPADTAAAVPTAAPQLGQVPYTKWYRVWERTQPSDFYAEMIVIPFIIVAIIVHFWGVSTNRRKARKWMAVHAPVLESEFALVGFHRRPKVEDVAQGNLLEAANRMTADGLPDDLIKEKTAWEYETYASGRQNVAFADFKVIMKRRMNPFITIAEDITGMFFESVKPKGERMEAVVYTFDGREKDFVPPPVPGSEEAGKVKGTGNSAYDPFVFAIVNKLEMRRLRDERYDVSLTFTKDNAKLPDWATVMSESAEITDTLLTKDLIAAVNTAGDMLNYLIVTDQPTDKPEKLQETQQKKRIHVSMKLPSSGDYSATLPLFQAFLRLPDHLANQAHFRPEVMRKINQTREAEKGKIKKVSDKEAEEERMKQLDKMKKEERDRKMKGMSAEEQRKYLEREAEKSRKKQEKKMSRKG